MSDPVCLVDKWTLDLVSQTLREIGKGELADRLDAVTKPVETAKPGWELQPPPGHSWQKCLCGRCVGFRMRK